MSLLLDALKKAEQEKAEKDADKSNAAEQSADPGQQDAEQAAVDQAAPAPAKPQVKFPDNDQNDLNLDDVTEFMGDGVRDEEAVSAQHRQPESPQLAEVDEDLDLTEDLLRDDDDIPDDVDLATTRQQSVADDNDAALELEPIDQELSLDELEVDDDGKISGPGGVPLDIDQFTSDLTIRRQDALQPRPSGPDNYDTSLVKGTAHKVAEPTSTYTSETERAMSPEYARKMFLRKKSSSKFFYYKIYAGISLVLLLAMAVWGLFEVESRFAQIEQGLVSLKRDPMPDTMRPGIDRSGQPLASSGMKADSKTKEIIAQAETFSSPQNEAISNAASQEKVPEQKIQTAEEQVKSVQTPTPGAQAVSPEQGADDNNRQPAASQQSTRPAQSRSAESSIQLSSKLSVEEKDRLLQQAYAAYEADDIEQARRDYDRVLELDGINRDGLLGRAAIHVIDAEYQAAIDKYQSILADNPNDSMALTSLISVANIDPEAGESQLKSLLRQQPETAYLYFALGNMYGNQQRWSEAQNAYFNALHLNASDPDYAYNLAVSLEHLGKPQAAVTYYQRALDNSRDLRANFDRQLVRQRIGVLAQ